MSDGLNSGGVFESAPWRNKPQDRFSGIQLWVLSKDVENLTAVSTSTQLLKVYTQKIQGEIDGTNLGAYDIKEMNKRRLDVLKLETNYFGSNKHSLLPTGKRTVWLLWKWRGYSGSPWKGT